MTRGPSPRVRRVIGWCVGGLIVWIALLASPLGTTTLELHTTSTTQGVSAMRFAATDTGANAPGALPVPLAKGANDLRFRFGLQDVPLTSVQHWSPCACGGTFAVSSIGMRSPLFHKTLPLRSVSAGTGLTNFTASGSSVTIVTDPSTAANPTVVISAGIGGFVAAVAGILLVLAALLTAVAFLLTRLVTRSVRTGKRPFARRIGGTIAGIRDAVGTESTLVRERPQPAVIPLPALVFWIAAAALAVNVVMIFVGGATIGIWVDEITHVSRMQSFLDNGWFLRPSDMSNGVPIGPDVYVYGPVQAIFGHLASMLVGADSLTTVSSSPLAYAARHISVGIFAIAGVTAVGGTTRLILRSWRWGVVAMAIVTAIPLFTGHAMFNPKDIAVAAGYSILTLSLALLARPRVLQSRRWTIVAVLLLVGGIVMSVGTRPGVWPTVFAGFALLVAVSLFLAPRELVWRDRVRVTVPRVLLAGSGIVASAVILLLIYPEAFGRPIALLTKSASSSADYVVGGRVGAAPSYIPYWMVAQIPTLILIAAAIGVVIGVVVGARVLLRRANSETGPVASAIVFVGAQLLLIPVFTILKHSVLYNGLRQLDFVLPALAVFATIAIARLAVKVAGRDEPDARPVSTSRSARGVIVFALAIVAIGLPTIQQGMLFPYNSDFISVAGGLLPNRGPATASVSAQTGNYDLANRELAPSIPAAGLAKCHTRTSAGTFDYTLDVAPIVCKSLRTTSPYLSSAAPSANAQAAESGRYLVWDPSVTFRLTPEQLATCKVLKSVTRPTLTGPLVISQLFSCASGATAVTVPATLSFAGSTDRDLFAGNWWHVQTTGVWSLGSSAGLRMSLPATSGSLALTITGYRELSPGATRSVSIVVNGTTVGSATFSVQGTAQTISATIPASVLAAGAGGILQLQLVTPHPIVPADSGDGAVTEPLGFFLKSLTITPTQ